MTDPQTAADAAERVQAVLDAHTAAARPSAHVLYAIPDPNRPRGWLHLTEPDLRALLAERKRMAAELEQVRKDRERQRNSAVLWRRRAYQLADLIPTEQMPDPDWYGEGASVALAERGEEMRDALTVAAELIDRLAFDDECSLDHHGCCQVHNVQPAPCPHPLGRRFVEAWRAVQADATAGMAASAAPDATGDTQTGEQRADGKRTPEHWCAEYGIDIADPDGWRNTGDPAWDEPITLPDFLRRAARSTCRGLTPDVWNRLSREAHEAADAEAAASAARDATERGAAPEGSVS